MTSPGTLNGIAVASVGAGVLLVYAAVQGKTVLGTVQAVIKGQPPGTAPSTAPAVLGGSFGNTPAPAGPTAAAQSAAYKATGSASGQQALNNAAAAYGWNAGAQWQALQNVEMAEAGFNPNATNPSSGAYGLGQALGHGQGTATQGTVTNEYGGFGVSDAVAQAANSGDAGAQAIWMCAYIKDVYGDPIAAWQHEQTYHWY